MPPQSSSIYDFTMNDIDGKPIPLSQFRGKTLLLVNTASFCGNTPQYSDLQTMYERYRSKGLRFWRFQPTTLDNKNRAPMKRLKASASRNTA
jgi:glutathione peroxidase